MVGRGRKFVVTAILEVDWSVLTADWLIVVTWYKKIYDPPYHYSSLFNSDFNNFNKLAKIKKDPFTE